MFDHTVPLAAQRVLSSLHSRRLRFHPLGLGVTSTAGWKMRDAVRPGNDQLPAAFVSLPDAVAHFGRSGGTRVDVLKLDCEGCACISDERTQERRDA